MLGEQETVVDISCEGSSFDEYATFSSFEEDVSLDQTQTHKPAVYFAHVDGVRAIAVVSVIVYHMNSSWLPGGFAGVDMFFVISGFVVTHSLIGKSASSRASFLCDFAARRVKRLLPALVLACTVCSVILVLLVPDHQRGKVLISLQTCMFGLLGNANNYLMLTHDDYWAKEDVGQENAFIHLWSLGVEEQFYSVFPWFFLISFSRRSSSKNQLSCFAWVFFGSLIFCICASGSGKHVLAMYTLPARAWELFSGAMFRTILDIVGGGVLGRYSKYVMVPLDIFAAALLVIGLLSARTNVGMFPFPAVVIPVTAALLMICLPIGGSSIFSCVLVQSWIVYIGKISYSLYLWHLPIITLFELATVEGLRSWLNCAGAVLATFFAATVSFHLVENPLRQRVLPSSMSLLLGSMVLGCTVVIICVVVLRIEGQMVEQTEPIESVSNELAFHLPSPPIFSSRPCACKIVTPLLHQPPDALPTVDARVELLPTCFTGRKNIATDFTYDMWVAACNELGFKCAHGASARISHDCARTCLGGPVSGNRQPRVFVLGDSHAHVIATSLKRMGPSSVFQLTYGAPHIEEHWKEIMQALLEVVDVRDVVVFSMRTAHFGINYVKRVFVNTEELLNLTISRRATLISIQDDPSYSDTTGKKGPRDCFLLAGLNVSKDCTMSVASYDEKTAPFSAALEPLLSRGLLVFDSFKYMFCDKARCYMTVPGTDMSAYMNGDHIGPVGAMYLTPFLCSFFQRHGLLYALY